MKKLVALLMVVSFLSTNTAVAFAEQRVNERGRVSGRVEQYQPDRRVIVRSPAQHDRRAVVNRPVHTDRRPVVNRHVQPDRRYVVNQPVRQSSKNNSMTPLKFLGIGAALIAIAAVATSSSSDY
jgi:Ni/Co efflux regulator RcnB